MNPTTNSLPLDLRDRESHFLLFACDGMFGVTPSSLASPFKFLFISRSRRQPAEYFILQRVSSGIFDVFIPSVLFFIFTRSLARGYLVTLTANLTQFWATSETRLCADIIKAGRNNWRDRIIRVCICL